MLAAEADLGAGPVWRIQSKVAPEAVPAVDDSRGVETARRSKLATTKRAAAPDLRPLRALGVPILDLSQDVEIFDVHHTVNDTLAQIDPKTLNQVVAQRTQSPAYLAASKSGDFGRVATEEKEQR